MSPGLVVVESRIVRATVFSDAAHVVRRAQPALVAGLNRVALPDLPRHADPAQLRVRTDHGRVRFVETDDLAWSEPAPPSSHEAAVAEALEQVHRLEGERAALQAELRLIDRVAPGRGLEGPLARLRPDVFLTGLEALTKRRGETLYAIRVAEYELHLAEERLADARDAAGAAGRTRELGPKASVVVGVEAEVASRAVLDVTYTCGWATWRPYYALRIDPNGARVEIARFADVWQETGEDWDDVDLVLSTAEPEERLVLPSVDPWILSARRSFDGDARDLYASRAAPSPAKTNKRAGPPPAQSRAPGAPPPPAPASAEARSELEAATLDIAPDEMEAYAAQYEEEGIFAEVSSAGLPAFDAGHLQELGGGAARAQAVAPPPPPPPRRPGAPPRSRRPSPDHPDLPKLLEHAPPRAASGGVDFELSVPGKSSCASGLGHRRIALGTQRHDTKVEYVLRPSLKDHAFGQATVAHDEDVPLLAGPAALFVEDAYFGSTRLLTTPAGGKLVLELGAETDVKSARRSRTHVRTEGIINKEDMHTVDVTIELESYKAAPVEVEVQDQIPISADARVKVRLLETSPKADLDTERGVLTFRLELAPRAPAKLTFRYEIEAPRDFELTRWLEAQP